MKLNKIFMFMCLILGASVGVNGALTDNQEVYYKFDGDSLDSTPNAYDGTVIGSTLTTGKINQG